MQVRNRVTITMACRHEDSDQDALRVLLKRSCVCITSIWQA